MLAYGRLLIVTVLTKASRSVVVDYLMMLVRWFEGPAAATASMHPYGTTGASLNILPSYATERTLLCTGPKTSRKVHQLQV